MLVPHREWNADQPNIEVPRPMLHLTSGMLVLKFAFRKAVGVTVFRVKVNKEKLAKQRQQVIPPTPPL